MRLAIVCWLAGAVLAAACARGDTPAAGRESPSDAASPSSVAPTEPAGAAGDGDPVLAGPDTSRHSVDLADIHFDLFNGTSVSLADASAETIAALVDAIPPLDADRDLLPPAARARVGQVRYVASDEAAFLEESAIVLGYVADDGEAYAFPVGILNFHEIVNDTLGGRPVVITYCPLCRSGVVYDRRLDGRVLTFGNTSALYQNDLVMFDRGTHSYWFQIGGEAVVGALTGSRLEARPSVMTTYSAWLALHPDTRILSPETGFERPYTSDPFAGYAAALNAGRFPFPVDEQVRADARLPAAAIVLVVADEESAHVFPLDEIGDAAVHARVGGMEIVVFTSEAGPSGAAFERTLDGRRLTFSAADGGYRDEETGSHWNLAGVAVSGELAGRRLTAVPSRTAFWFSVVAAFDTVEIAALP